MSGQKRRAFTLIELLVVVSIIALLLSILLPALNQARSQGQSAVCKSNIRQLAIANIGYSTENNDYYVLAAEDFYLPSNNLRWHGARDSKDEPFDSARSPLAGYFGDGRVKQCPKPIGFRHGEPWDFDFEDGCGGYGYNMTYLGSRIWDGGTPEGSTRASEVRAPARTLMFADTAMAKLDSGRPYYLEYSFAEPRYFVIDGEIYRDFDPSPSIHFRHGGQANVAWVDGHVEVRLMGPFDGVNAYGVNSSEMMLGWFEPMDNGMFDLR